MITPEDIQHLKRCIALAEEALLDGAEPFGSVLVSAAGEVLREDRNRVMGGDHTRHPEFELARWSASNLTPDQRTAATVYPSGEHCPMCAAAHAWVGLGRIVYASSSSQLTDWARELGFPPSPVAALPIQTIAPQLEVLGPVPELSQHVYALHQRRSGAQADK